MAVQFKYFSIPALAGHAEEEELNRFLRSVRVLSVRHEFIMQPHTPCWCVMVEYMEAGGETGKHGKSGRKQKDYKEILSPEDFAMFCTLREWRKKQAEQDQIPVYTIFTNEQLAKLATTRPNSLTGLQEIEGIGEARVQKYGEQVLSILHNPQGHGREKM